MKNQYNNHDVYKKALLLAIPMMIQNGITNMVSLIDNIMVGKLGTESMTGVSIVGQLLFVFNLAVFGGLSGPGIFGAQFYGQGNKEGFQNTFRIKLWIGCLCMLAGFCLFSFLDTPLIQLYLKGDSAEIDSMLTLAHAQEYLGIMIFSLLPFVLAQVYATSLREMGNSFLPMVAGIISVFTDVVLNYLLIYGKFGFPRLEVRGAALATLIARFVEAAVIIVWTHAQRKKNTSFCGMYRTLLIPRQLVGKVIPKSIPLFFNEFMWAGGIAALTQCYSIRGLSVVAGLNISNAICNLLNVVFVALGAAVGIIIGQTLGASKYEKAKNDAFRLMWFTGFLCLFLTAILIGISGIFPEFYNTSEAIRQKGQMFIILTAVFFPVQGVLNSLYFTLRSGGQTVITFLFDSIYSWVITVPVGFVLCMYTDWSIYAVYVIVQSLDIIKVFIGYALVKKGVWINNMVEKG